MPGETQVEETADDADVVEEALDVDMDEAVAPGAPPPPPEDNAIALPSAATAARVPPPAPGPEPTTARLLAQALTSKARAEDERVKAESRAQSAEAALAELRKRVEETRQSSPPSAEGAAAFDASQTRQLRHMKEELEAAKATLDENFEEVAQLRVQLRAAEEATRAAKGVSAPVEERAAAAEANLNASRLELEDLRMELTRAQDALKTAETGSTEVVRLRGELETLQTQLNSMQHEATTLQHGNEALVARSDIAKLDADRTREELARANDAMNQVTEELNQERTLRMHAEAAQTAALQTLEAERANAHKENEVLGQALLEEEQQSARLREQLQALNTRVTELQRNQDSQSQSSASEVARLQKELFEAETERKDALERARKADREAKVVAREVAALTEELKRAKGGGAEPESAAPADTSGATAEELARAQKRLNQYGEEIKRLRAELASVGKSTP